MLISIEVEDHMSVKWRNNVYVADKLDGRGIDVLKNWFADFLGQIANPTLGRLCCEDLDKRKTDNPG